MIFGPNEVTPDLTRGPQGYYATGRGRGRCYWPAPWRAPHFAPWRIRRETAGWVLSCGDRRTIFTGDARGLNDAFMRAPSIARREHGTSGAVVLGHWMVPAVGASRFDTLWLANTAYGLPREAGGDDPFEYLVLEEASKSRPGQKAYQVYIRSTGRIEGLVR